MTTTLSIAETAAEAVAAEAIAEPGELRRRVAAWRSRGERIALVPTMGALHAGHLALVTRGRQLADRVVASIFVNPTQFGPGEDFAGYPRQVEQDLAALGAAGCDLAFTPEAATLYPPGASTWVEVGGPSQGQEGDRRPGHFRGVATVVTKLLNLVQPDVAIFGEKDAQQLAVVRALARDLLLPIEIVGHPIVREADGLAMSSRNAYLDVRQRLAARVLSRALRAAQEVIHAGEREAEAILMVVRGVLAAERNGRIDSVALVDADSFVPVSVIQGRCVLPIVFQLGRTRLLDNLQISVGADGKAVARL